MPVDKDAVAKDIKAHLDGLITELREIYRSTLDKTTIALAMGAERMLVPVAEKLASGTFAYDDAGYLSGALTKGMDTPFPDPATNKEVEKRIDELCMLVYRYLGKLD